MDTKIKEGDRVIAIGSLSTSADVGTWGTVEAVIYQGQLYTTYRVQFDGATGPIECEDWDLVPVGKTAILAVDDVLPLAISALAARHKHYVDMATKPTDRVQHTVATTVAAEIRLLITMLAGWKIEGQSTGLTRLDMSTIGSPLPVPNIEIRPGNAATGEADPPWPLVRSPDTDILTGETIG